MQDIIDIVKRPRYSRSGRANAKLPKWLTYKPKKRTREEPEREHITAKDAAQIYEDIKIEIKEETSKNSKHDLGSYFFQTVSREKREQTNKYIKSDAPPVATYTPKHDLVSPRTYSQVAFTPKVTVEKRTPIVYLPECLDTNELACKYPEKPLSAKGTRSLNSLSLKDFINTLSTRESQVKDSIYPESAARPHTAEFRFNSQLPRKWSVQQLHDMRFENFNHFPRSYSKSRIIKTPIFEKTKGRENLWSDLPVNDGNYDLNFELLKKKLSTGFVDFEKMSSRFGKDPDPGPMPPTTERLANAIEKIKPRIRTPYIAKRPQIVEKARNNSGRVSTARLQERTYSPELTERKSKAILIEKTPEEIPIGKEVQMLVSSQAF